MGRMITVEDYEERAMKILPLAVRDYYKSGAGDECSLRWNRTAFDKYRIRPKVLRNVSNRDTSTVVLGQKVSMPLGVSPTAMQRMAHPDGECANARAAQAAGTVFTLSTLSTCSIEQVAEAAPEAIKWFQLYIYFDRDVTLDLIRRAEASGFKALVVTVDTPMFGARRADIRNNFALPGHLRSARVFSARSWPFPSRLFPASLHEFLRPRCPSLPKHPMEKTKKMKLPNNFRLANFQGASSGKINCAKNGSGLEEYVKGLFDDSLSWNDVAWVKSVTNLPIVLKGILTAEDALLCVKYGASGVLVSNHGARQIDGTAATIEALSEIVEAVGDKVEVYLDGGVTRGTDVLKALALGAKMVFVGRAMLWGLACGGEEGAKAVLEILKRDIDRTFALAGCRTVGEVTRDTVAHESQYSRL